MRYPWFNRTFMELKLKKRKRDEKPINRFNRTFMELKPLRKEIFTIIWIGLIVPLWN